MTSHKIAPDELRLELDFGEVGWHFDRRRFAVTLDASRLGDLVDTAQRGLRVYELVTLRRPGDLWAYVDVLAISLPTSAQGRWDQACRFQPKGDQRLPFEQFDSFFRWMGDDTEPDHAAWRGRWDAEPTRQFIAALFVHVQRACAVVEGGDPLTQHELQRMRAGRHAYDALPLSTVRTQSRSVMKQEADRYSESFYAVLARMLCRPEVEAVSYRDLSDYRVLRSMCLEQRRRADALGCAPDEALRLSAMADNRIDNTAWGSTLWMYDEGVGWGDLFIEGDVEMGEPLPRLNGTHWQRFGRWVLSTKDLGDLKGYSSERGDGWVLYEALPDTPIPRPPKQRW